MNWLSMIGGGASLLGGLFGSKPKGYDIGSLSQMKNYEQMLNQQMQLGKGLMDPSSTQNRLMKQMTMQNTMDQIGVQNQLSSRNPFTSSGILQAQGGSNILKGIRTGSETAQQGYLQNMGTGLQTLNTGISNYGGLAENYAQQSIANQQLQNQYGANMGGLLGQFGMGMIGGG